MKKAYIIRHGKAETAAHSDRQRPLHLKGINQSKYLNQYLIEHSVNDVSVFYSSALRTEQTFNYVSADIKDLISFPKPEMYAADFMLLLRLMASHKNNSDLIVIGHNPGISRLVEYLSGESYYARTGTMAIIQFNIDNWDEITKDSGRLLSEVRYLDSN